MVIFIGELVHQKCPEQIEVDKDGLVSASWAGFLSQVLVR